MAKRNAGNLRFTDREQLPWPYRQRFLHYTDQIAPEVLTSLKELIPKFNALFADRYSNDVTYWITGEDRFTPDAEAELFLLLAIPRSNGDTTISAQAIVLRNFHDLKNAYSDFLTKFGLDAEWLRRDLFTTIRLFAHRPEFLTTLTLAYAHAWMPLHGEDIELQIRGWHAGDESWQEFEKRARSQFEKEMNLHKEETIALFTNSGYKKTTKPLDFTPVKWLVYWTVKRMSKADILAKIDKERNDANKPYDLKSLEYHFRQLKKYDLPVRQG